MKLKTLLIMAGLWIGLFGLTACGGADVRTYQYPETAVLFNDFHIKKTVYSPGVMKLYYRGGQFKDTPIRCYDANFEDLGDQFEYSFQNGVLTVQADFAEQISGLTIEDKDHDTVYHLRYLDSPQFAWLADTFWLDYGMMTMGDEARYYSDAERQAQAERESAEHGQTHDVFALLEGTWISEDGLQKYVFSTDADGSELRAAELWFDETEQKWNGCASSPRFRRRISAENTVRTWRSTCSRSCWETAIMRRRICTSCTIRKTRSYWAVG